MLRTWGGLLPIGEALQNLIAGLESVHGRSMGEGGGGGLKMVFLKSRENPLKNEGVHLLVKLAAMSLQACSFTENELLHTYFSRILARFKLLFIVF